MTQSDRLEKSRELSRNDLTIKDILRFDLAIKYDESVTTDSLIKKVAKYL